MEGWPWLVTLGAASVVLLAVAELAGVIALEWWWEQKRPSRPGLVFSMLVAAGIGAVSVIVWLFRV